jgi:hypothetical protein
VPTELQIPLRGPNGEPVDLVRTFMSHGVADLRPGQVDEAERAYTTTLMLPRAQPRAIRISEGRPGFARVEVDGRKLRQRTSRDLTAAVRQILNLDEDLSEFYALVADDPDLSWTAAGAGRMLRTPTVFEAAVKTICTTNVAWSATVRMVNALVDNLGERAASGAHAFPTAEAMASVPESFYRETVRAGYRSAYLHALASGVVAGTFEVEELGLQADLTDAIASAVGNAWAPLAARSPRLSTSALTMRTVADHATFVVQIVFTTASNTVWVRTMRPAPREAQERSGSFATRA